MMRELMRRLPQSIDTKVQLQRQSDQLGLFTRRREQLVELEARLQRLVATAEILRREDIARAPAGLGEAIARLLKELRTAYAAQPEETLDKPFTQMKDKLEKLLASGEKAQGEAWSAHVQKQLRALPEELFGILQKIPAFESTVREVRHRTEVARKRGLHPPHRDEEFQAFRDGLEAIELAWRKLGSDSVPGDVVGFLREAVAQGGAPLDLLTEPVREWLITHQVLSAFRIRLK